MKGVNPIYWNGSDKVEMNPSKDNLYINEITHDPTGFLNKDQSILSFDNGTRTFTISPVSLSFTFFIKGIVYEISTNDNIQISSQDGFHVIYYNELGNLTTTNIFDWKTILTENCIVAVIYWNTIDSEAIYIGDKRHELRLPGILRSIFHETLRCKILQGLTLASIIVDGDGSLDELSQLSVENGLLLNADLLFSIEDNNPQKLTFPAEIPILYRFGSGAWRKKSADTFPIIYSGSTIFMGSNDRVCYNLNNSGNWTLEEVGDQNYVLVHLFATNDINNPIIGFQGINEYTNINDARDGAESEINSISFLSSDTKEIGTIIFQTADAYTNTTKATLISTNTGDGWVEFRQDPDNIASAPIDHSQLGNLTAGDPHTQYRLANGSRDNKQYQMVSNLSGSTINQNKVVTLAADDSVNDLPAVNTISDFSQQPIGIVVSPILDGTRGKTITRGRLVVNGLDTSTLDIGDPIYYDIYGDLSVIDTGYAKVGYVLSPATNGVIFVNI